MSITLRGRGIQHISTKKISPDTEHRHRAAFVRTYVCATVVFARSIRSKVWNWLPIVEMEGRCGLHEGRDRRLVCLWN